jgi:hypothetical protein
VRRGVLKVSSNVTRTTSATVPSTSHALRPRTLPITPTPSTPSTPRSTKRTRHARTVSAETRQRRAISKFATPSAANNKPWACTTARCGNDVDRAIRTSVTRCSSDTTNGAATNTGIPQH